MCDLKKPTVSKVDQLIAELTQLNSALVIVLKERKALPESQCPEPAEMTLS
jgi:hypothetical protein|tara:strand:- start:395 stop:547 length:153 start_codon:yes stop_codon:yes gene_type:complete